MKQQAELKNRNVVFRLTEDELMLIDRLAGREDRSRSQFIRRLVADGLERLDHAAPLNAVKGMK